MAGETNPNASDRGLMLPRDRSDFWLNSKSRKLQSYHIINPNQLINSGQCSCGESSTMQSSIDPHVQIDERDKHQKNSLISRCKRCQSIITWMITYCFLSTWPKLVFFLSKRLIYNLIPIPIQFNPFSHSWSTVMCRLIDRVDELGISLGYYIDENKMKFNAWMVPPGSFQSQTIPPA